MPVMGLAQEPLFRVGDFKTRSLAEAKKSSGFTCSKFYYDKDGIFTTCFKTFDTYDSESESCQSDTLLRCCFAVPSSIEKITEATKNIVQTSLKNGREIVDLINAANKTLEKCVPKQSFHLEMGAVGTSKKGKKCENKYHDGEETHWCPKEMLFNPQTGACDLTYRTCCSDTPQTAKAAARQSELSAVEMLSQKVLDIGLQAVFHYLEYGMQIFPAMFKLPPPPEPQQQQPTK
uniref:Uncharacterized protein n=1 Tax=Panagrolaimus davidi TaxID=227884 RepID=A0A914NXR5_9BILA